MWGRQVESGGSGSWAELSTRVDPAEVVAIEPFTGRIIPGLAVTLSVAVPIDLGNRDRGEPVPDHQAVPRPPTHLSGFFINT